MPDEERKLMKAGVALQCDAQIWEDMFRLAMDYYTKHKNMDVQLNYRAEDGALLGAWVYRQKKMMQLIESMPKYQKSEAPLCKN